MKEIHKKLKLDPISFQLGMINCFVEMVECGVKKLALSPPISQEAYEKIGVLSEKIVREFGIQSYLEKSLLITDLQSEEFTKSKYSILYYSHDEVLKEYLELKKRKEELMKTKQYDEKNRKQISREFGRLLSYPDELIERKLSEAEPPTPFVLEF
jgi:hypothetical protein